ncbi:MAG: carboxymuconolactone decarboxylase family protein [Erysipelotrichia bacterium]|jgi:AhpD family alkylhydroperoxidase|nr:carboxymuconolactone decarboxylase family protein [Erysipelotrichia bacterium]
MKVFKNKKIYTYQETFRTAVCFFNGLRFIKQAKQAKAINKPFVERIMLGVTEVNGCTLCSYQHTGIALKAGLTREEIKALLDGELESVNDNEIIGVLFGKHVADQRGLFDKEAYDRMVKEYGDERALGVLGAVRIIMFTNIIGIMGGVLFDTLTFKNKKLGLFLHELVRLPLFILMMPLAFMTFMALQFTSSERLKLGYKA